MRKRFLRRGGVLLAILVAILLLLQSPLLYHRARIGRLAREIATLNAIRMELPPKDGLLDLRGAIHVHSQISSDSLGTLEEIIEGAKACGVDFIVMAEHPIESALETTRDAIQGLREGILFIPGVEMDAPCGGILAFGWDGIELAEKEPVALTAQKVRDGGGLIFICHPEAWKDWDLPLNGVELVNLHADVEDENLLELIPRFLYSFRRYPFLCFQEAYDFPLDRLKKWDEILAKRRFVAIAGNDAHRNIGIQLASLEDGRQVLRRADGDILDETPPKALTYLIRLLGKKGSGEVKAELIIDEYANSFSYVSTRILSESLDPKSAMDALREGRCYICYEALCDPKGFRFSAHSAGLQWLMGDEIQCVDGLEMEIVTPVSCEIRLIKDGRTLTSLEGSNLIHAVEGPGAYRVECWLTLLGTQRLWILSNPILVRP